MSKIKLEVEIQNGNTGLGREKVKIFGARAYTDTTNGTRERQAVNVFSSPLCPLSLLITGKGACLNAKSGKSEDRGFGRGKCAEGTMEQEALHHHHHQYHCVRKGRLVKGSWADAESYPPDGVQVVVMSAWEVHGCPQFTTQENQAGQGR